MSQETAQEVNSHMTAKQQLNQRMKEFAVHLKSIVDRKEKEKEEVKNL